ncbi:MAG: hypothetical protein JSV89_09945 [Spirochaetaceae bacterium]|nr:MAG: hypothetical protein JSV89_09945 [Spirochaetaceae bacterium]
MARYLILYLILIFLLGGCMGSRPTKQPPADTPELRDEAPKTSLPAPVEAEPEELKPAEEPAPPEIGYQEAVRQISRLYPKELQPFSVQGRIPIVLHDLDNDKHPECLSLGVPSQGIDSKTMNRLSESSRLFEEDSEPVAFSLLVFANNQGNFQRLKILDLAEHIVFDSLRRTPLYKNRSLPVIITVSFQIVEGREVELLVFDSASGLPRSRHTLSETLSTQYRLEDIDGNGMIDLFVKEKAMEEGTGFETFLTWYRWSGRDFVQYRSRNVVRNLNAFLESAAELLLAGEIREIVGFLLDPSSVRTLRRKGWSDHKILIHTFGLEEVGLEEFPSLREVVFPPLLEDPFTSEDEEGSSFEITYRMIDLNGTSYIAKARLYMLTNPFKERQFAFSPTID